MSAIVTVPNPVLREPAKTVTELDKKVLSIIDDMTATLLAAKNPEGVGLAAPQIGISLRIFLIRPSLRSKPQVFINPEIIKLSQRVQSPDSKNGVYEGCLSIPAHYSPLSRAMSVVIKYQTPDSTNLQLKTHQKTFTGFAAHIIQHETDHLNGVLFIDRVLEQNSKLYRIDGKEWQEITL